MGSQYRRGADFENKVKEDFEDAGYYVMRSAGSKGVADLIALDMLLPGRRPVMVQCKLPSAPLSVAGWNHLFRIGSLCGVAAVVASKSAERGGGYELHRITAERAPNGQVKAWVPWVLDPGRDAPAMDPVALAPLHPAGFRSAFLDTRLPVDATNPPCDCQHPMSDHAPFCMYCECAAFRVFP